MKNFDSLRNKKKNIEAILNTISAFQELKRIKDDLPEALDKKKIDKCLKLAQSFEMIENVIIKEFCNDDFQFVKSLIEIDL